MFLPANPLLTDRGAALVVFRLLDLLANYTQRLFQELGGFLAVRSLESHGVDGNVSNWRHDDFDREVHIPTPMSTSLMDPFG